MAGKGIELSFGLAPGLQDEDAVAQALANLAGWELSRIRKERLEWRILRVVEVGQGHHFLLLLRHPDRTFDFGLSGALKQELEVLRMLSEPDLMARFAAAFTQGLRPQAVEVQREKADYWLDEDWALRWVGDAAGIDR